MRLVWAQPVLWIGHAGDVRDLAALRRAGVRALVDVALNEPPLLVTRRWIYCRFGLTDGGGAGGNERPMVRLAVHTTAALLRAGIPTLVFCSAGMSRSVSVAAGALALATGRGCDDCLREVVRTGPADVSPALWHEVLLAAAAPAGWHASI